jgi:predicted Zn finger-like uncharacterized protein
MDVRCDRCQTEYELDDASVTERGASVQCTTCGHTFMVSRPRAEFTPTPSPTTETAAPSWVLTTEEGKVHRFRDPTTLQKWIVERRVGRNDRVTAPGASARRLGDMDELRPFFDLVDQADRTSATRVARPTQPETPQRLGAAGRGYASPDEDDDDMLMGRRSRGGQRDRVSRLDSDIAAGLTTMGMDDSMGVVLPRRNTARNVALALLALGGIAGGFYFGTRSGGLPKVGVASAPAVAPTPAPAPAAPPPAPPVAVAPVAAPAAPPPAPAAAPAAPAPAAVPAAPSAPVAAAKHAPPPEELPDPPQPTRPSSGRSAAAAPSTGGAMPHKYEQLVAEANRALENGNTAKAQKFVDEALKLQPSGVSAVTASAYLLLDRRKPLAAVGEFKRALNNAPNFPQALFGLGEAYRSAGDTPQAIDAYKKYLAAAPGGEDAPAARRQLRELEVQPARPSHSATAPVPDPGSGNTPPMPQPAPPP